MPLSIASTAANRGKEPDMSTIHSALADLVRAATDRIHAIFEAEPAKPATVAAPEQERLNFYFEVL